MYEVEHSDEFREWLHTQTLKAQAQILSRLALIHVHEYFGDAKNIDKSIAELRWRNGRRLYFCILDSGVSKKVLILIGGNKNGQSKDIIRARRILTKICEE